ncbi:hypothetical protein QR680_019267 [Steinernema hermaphroditum]|uniref:Abnormal cell migration protein 18-like fibronectin type I domain-containing protein n=1 Tax=Steinernema hermaphroditum TaxID=289476 RepID=A0AA39HMT5_9BILA|nr:hypothetical protein QR680_019267 [Steinernema hermaphroditum]
MPNNFVDKLGNEVPNKANSHKGPDGKDVYDCIDVMGAVKAHGTEYERPNGRFKYRCNNGIEEVSEPRCNVNGKDYHIGDEIEGAYIRMVCQETGYKVLGCYYFNDKKDVVKMNPGTTAEDGDVVHHCDDNDGNIQYYAQPSGCTKLGKKYKEGEEFTANHLRYKCNKGVTNIEGCYIDEHRDLNVGQDIVDGKMVYRCYRLGPKVQYEEYACGYNGTPSCKPEPIPSTPDDIPSLGHGLKAPGFSSFGVVQTIGPEKFAGGTNTVKLDLNKLLMSSQGSH